MLHPWLTITVCMSVLNRRRTPIVLLPYLVLVLHMLAMKYFFSSLAQSFVN